MIDDMLDQIDRRMAVITEGRRVKIVSQLPRAPKAAQLLKPLPGVNDSMAAFDLIRTKLVEIVSLMDSGDVDPGDMDRLYRVFGFLRAFARKWQEEDMGEAQEPQKRRQRKRLRKHKPGTGGCLRAR